jgi:regulator of sigma E protease
MSDILSWFLTNPFVAFIALVGIVVFVHELGHYLAGVWMNIAIEEFSLGFGPTAWSFKKGRTEYKICWLPLGGYVRFFGQETGEITPPELEGRALNTAPVYKRAIISAAGPFANFILSLVVMIALSKVGLPKPAPVVSVMPEGVARKAGLQTGDKILAIAGEKVESWADINRLVSSRPEKSTVFEVERGSARMTFEMTPAREMSETLFGEPIPVGRIGVSQFFETARVVLAPQDSTLRRAGLQNADKILEVNGKKVSALHDVEQAVAVGPVSLLVERMAKPAEELLQANAKDNLLGSTQTLTLTTDAAIGAEEWAQTVRSTDMTIKSFESLNKGDRKIPAQDAWKTCGLKPGDTIFSWSGYPNLQGPVDLSYNLHKLVRPDDTGAVALLWQVVNLSDNQMRSLECKIPRRLVLDALGRNQWSIDLPVSFVSRGVAVAPVTIRSESFVDSVKDGAAATWQQSTTILTALKKLFSGDVPLSNLGGPIAIARVAGDAAEGGLLLFVLTISWMSLNIGLFNLLPLPALDGGHLILQAVEAAYGRPLPLGVQLAVQRIGVALLLGLIVLVFFNDILRLFRS